MPAFKTGQFPTRICKLKFRQPLNSAWQCLQVGTPPVECCTWLFNLAPGLREARVVAPCILTRCVCRMPDVAKEMPHSGQSYLGFVINVTS